MRADSLARSVVLLLILTVLQRAIGFARGLLFCRWLTPEQLGEWELSFSFLMMACPIAILSLPGVFGRYLEYYRHRGQLRMFLGRTGIATLAMVSVSAVTIAAFDSWFSTFIFGRDDQRLLVWMMAAALFVVVIYNFATDLFTALRQQRVASRLQLINTLAFAVISAFALLLGGQSWGAGAVLASYLAAAVVSVVGIVPLLGQTWRETPLDKDHVSQKSFWSRLAPFALSIWATSWLTNLFCMVDRYMIVHYSGLDSDAALAVVGQYHTARLVPMLILSFAHMLAGALMPYLSHEWEAHGRQAVSDRMNLVLKVLSVVLLPGSAVLLLISPWLFHLLGPGKFNQGLEVMPMTMCFCVISSLACVSRNWLWCDERASLSNLAYLLGLLTCVGMSLIWLPVYGLMGVAAATLVGNVAALVGMLAFNRRRGMSIQRGTPLLMIAPLAIAGGATAALLVTIIILALVWRTNLIFSSHEKQQLIDATATYLSRYRLWPGAKSSPGAH